LHGGCAIAKRFLPLLPCGQVTASGQLSSHVHELESQVAQLTGALSEAKMDLAATQLAAADADAASKDRLLQAQRDRDSRVSGA
jgi:outer membrane murein-binding lipoprotein Lpp